VHEADEENADRTARAARETFDEGSWGTITVYKRGQVPQITHLTPEGVER